MGRSLDLVAWVAITQALSGCAGPPTPVEGSRAAPPLATSSAPGDRAPGVDRGAAGPRSRIAVSSRHSCVIGPSGRVACWGNNDLGQLGDGTRVSRATPAPVKGIEGAEQIDADDDETCVTTREGRVLCWGAEVTSPREAPDVRDAVQVSIGHWHTCAVLRAGKVRCWGAAWLGDGRPGSVEPNASTSLVAGIDDAVEVQDSCVLRRSGEVRCWGLNSDGELGDGTRDTRATPVPVHELKDAIAIATAPTHACALRRGGEVVCWGRADLGQLGDGVGEQRRLVPAPVPGIVDGVAISASGMNTCVTRRSGLSLCWGGNAYGRLGEGTGTGYGRVDLGTSAPLPVAVPGLSDAIEVAAGPAHACARLASGEVACWGDNPDGQLGGGFAAHTGTSAKVEGITDAARIATGPGYACALLRGGEVTCWGNNRVGQLGDGTRKSRGSPAKVGGLSGVQRISAFAEHACALKAQGAIACWGWEVPEIGPRSDNEFAFLTPQTVTTIADAVDISTSHHHTCARRRSGAVACWGEETFGQLGGKLGPSGRGPVSVFGIPDAIEQATSDLGGCAVRRGGSLLCWGAGAIDAWVPSGPGVAGGLPASPSPQEETKPTLLRGLTDVAGVGFGSLVTCLLRRSGRARCWGTETRSLLPVNPLPPSAEVTGLTDGAQIKGLLVLRATGEIVSLGADSADGSRWSATAVRPEIRDAIDVAGSDKDGCAVQKTGEVVCWGDDSTGQLGAGAKARSEVPVKVVGIP